MNGSRWAVAWRRRSRFTLRARRYVDLLRVSSALCCR
ncbi:MAG: putative leader peptide [Kibdelosporangium sp.]